MGVVFGRSSELALVEDSLGAGEPCALVGESGIGKTTLARAVAARFGPSLVGGGLSTLSWVPYVPLWLALGQKLPSGDDAHVADEVARRVGDGLLVVDDLQWADGGTRRVVELLAGRVRLLTAVRSDEAEAAEAVAVCERAGMRIVRLEPLDADASLALIETLRDDLPRARALRLVERARGNPLFLQELAETGALSRSFRLALAARIRRLTPAAQEALGLLALLGRPAPAGTLPEPAAAELLERGFVEQAGGTLAIRHPLFAEAAAADLGEDLRRRLHARLAELVDDQGEAAHHLAAAGMAERAGELALAAAAQAPSQAERAALLALAASSADGERGVELSLQAARELARCGEHAAAERLLDGLPPLEGHRLAEAACIRWGTRWELGDLEGAKAEVRRGL
ncbi:MAG: hypothetical protein ACXVZ4_13035, partial [Gaiellaceae bacterium]